jgi:O-antigen/teichoic acid export membrane protein
MLKNGFYNLFSTLTRAILTFGSIPLLNELMGIEEYGIWVLVQSILNMLIIIEGGLPISATVFVAEDLASKDNDRLSKTITSVVLFMIILATFIAVILTINANSITNLFPSININQKREISLALQFGSIGLWANLLQQLLIGIENAYENFKLPNQLNSIQWFLLSIGSIAIANNGGKSVLLSIWQSLVIIFILTLHLIYIRRITTNQKIKFLLNKDRSVQIITYGFASWMVVIGRALYTRGDRIIVGSILSPASLGIYHAIQEITGAVAVFSSLIVQPAAQFISTHLSSPKSSKKDDEFQSKILNIFRINIFTALIISIALFIMATNIIELMYSNLDQNKISNILLCFRTAIIINTIVAFNGAGYWILFGLKKVNISAFLLIISGIFSLMTIFWGTSKSGLIGACVGNFTYTTTIILSIIASTFLLNKNKRRCLFQYYSLILSILIAISVQLHFF